MYAEFIQKVTKGQTHDGSMSQNTFHVVYKPCAKCHAFIKKVHNYFLCSSTNLSTMGHTFLHVNLAFYPSD